MASEARIEIDLSSPEPAYRQVAGQLRALIVNGTLKPDDALPPVRRLAVDLGVHFNTIAEAYRQLAEEGHVEVNQGKAARVVQRAHTKANAATREHFAARLRSLLAEARASGMDREELRKLVEGELT
jgi:GntR family transcriptional regulator